MAELLERLDAYVSTALGSWDVYTTILTASIIAFILYSIVYPDEPDVHPMLLLRQASPSLVRQPGESAVYRSHETPHGYPLKTGLGVKPKGAPTYSPGKDGDLRDVWRRVTGEIPWEAPRVFGATAPAESDSGKILTVFGREKVQDEALASVGREIAAIGEAVRKAGAKRVAIYLPNSVELLSVLFAGAFYSFDVVLIPYTQPSAVCIQELNKTGADALIAAAGSLPLADVTRGVKGLKQVVWVVEETSRHMDWTEVSKDVNVEVQQWHEVAQESKTSGSALPQDGEPGKVVTLARQPKTKGFAITEFTQKNLVAGIAALSTSLPPNQRLNPSDLFLPADLLSDAYTLCWTMAALFSHATVVLNSVAGPEVSISESAKFVSPTVIVASSIQGAMLYDASNVTPSGALKKLGHYAATQALQAGRMPVDGLLARLGASTRGAAIGATPGKLRLLYISEPAGSEEPTLSRALLSDLRVYTGARVVYALTAAGVAGAVAQSNIYDYRTSGKGGFGAPLASVELRLRDSGKWKTREGSDAQGEIVVTGPAVAGGEVALGVIGTFSEDHALAYVDTEK